jgi:molybdopterin molybdotransferase
MPIGVLLIGAFLREVTMTELFKLMSVEQAWGTFKEHIFLQHMPLPAVRVETISVRESLGRVLAVDVAAANDVPGFSRSTMDGFAVRARDTFGASEAMPAMLEVIGEVFMGQTAVVPVQAGQTVRVATGGM